MNVAVIRVWREEQGSIFVKFSDLEIATLFDKIISLEKDADFLNPLRAWNEECYAYFLDKIPYVRGNRNLFLGEIEVGRLVEMPRRKDLELPDQEKVNSALARAVQF